MFKKTPIWCPSNFFEENIPFRLFCGILGFLAFHRLSCKCDQIVAIKGSAKLVQENVLVQNSLNINSTKKIFQILINGPKLADIWSFITILHNNKGFKLVSKKLPQK